MKQKSPHKEYQRKYSKERRKRLRKAHLCLQCKKQDERTRMGYCHCAECSEQAKQRYERKRYEREITDK